MGLNVSSTKKGMSLASPCKFAQFYLMIDIVKGLFSGHHRINMDKIRHLNKSRFMVYNISWHECSKKRKCWHDRINMDKIRHLNRGTMAYSQ